MKMLEQHYDAIMGGIPKAWVKDLLCMDITPAAKWFWSESPKEYWEYSDDFPCIVPPSPMTWMEFEAPDRIASTERVIENHQLKRDGALMLTFEIQPERREMALEHELLLQYMANLDGAHKGRKIDWAGSRAYRQQYHAEAKAKGIQARWITVWNIIAEARASHLPVHPHGLFGMYLDESGRVIKGLNACIHGMNEAAVKQLEEEMGTVFDPFADALPFMFALSLSHCKNVTQSDMVPPPALARKRKEKGVPSFTYRVLDVKPMMSTSRTMTAVNGQGDIQNALHFVRGHMKTFSADKPLFGKHTGTYWWSLQLRGEEEAGIALKDYRVKAA